MKLIKPKKLELGDTIGFLSVSGAVKDISELEFSKKYLEDCGYKVKVSDTSYTQDRYFCASDDVRAKALNDFFADDEIKAIICCRGGYGAIRILDKIDYNLIKRNPKIFCGYSDISAILWTIYQKTGLITFHGAHAVSTFKEQGVTQNYFWQNMRSELKQINVQNNKVYKSGVAKGALLGGNLCTLASMCGTDFAPKEDFILFLEDLNEPSYKIDRMFTQLIRTKGFIKHLKGIALGEFTQTDNEQYLHAFWQETAEFLNVPVCGEFLISHNIEHAVIPYGLSVELDTDNGQIKFLQTYLK